MKVRIERWIAVQGSVLTAFFLFFCFTLHAQELKFNHITSKQGLSQAVVNCIVKDKKGFMWFGTQDGLNKYDGYNITVFRHDPADASTLSDNYINCLFVDADNILWIGTNGAGLDRYNPATNSFSHFDLSLQDNSPDNTIRAIFKDADGMFWIGTEMGLVHFDPVKGKFTHTEISKDNLSVRSIVRDQKGRLWFSTYGYGLFSYDPSNGSHKQFDLTVGNSSPSTSLNNVNKARTLCVARDGMIYIGTNGGGMPVFDPASEKIIKTYVADPDFKGPQIGGGVIMAIQEDANGMLWLGTISNGVSELDPSNDKLRVDRHSVSNPSSIGNDNIKCVFMDEQGDLWFGTNGGGVDVYFRSAIKFKHYLLTSNPFYAAISNVVYSISQDSKGLLWIGTSDAGLVSYDLRTGEMNTYPSYINSGNSTVLSVYEDKDSTLWLGTYGSGLSSYDKRTGKVTYYTGDGTPKYKEESSAIKNGTITCITSDHRGLIWVGTYGGGVYCYNKKTAQFLSYRETNGLTSDFVYRIYEDKAGNMWIGTQYGGACVLDFNTKKITATYMVGKNKKGISSNIVNNFYEDAAGTMWIATANGLNKLDVKTGKFTYYFIKDGLANDYIYSIIPDEDGKFWMSTNKGVTRFDPAVENKEGSAFRNYDKNDGLQDDEFSQGAFYRNPHSGEIFLGGLNGFNTFQPSQIKSNKHIPPVYITSYKRFGKEVKLDTLINDKKFIELSYKDNFFSFEFVSLDYVFPEKNKYMYKMEGLDQDWSPATSNRYASYTNLEGGDYVFRVRGCNNDGVWNDEGATLHITIIPPFWKTKTFYALCILLGIALVFGYTRWRTEAIKKEKRVLELKVEERTAELAQKNKDITSSIQYAERIQRAILPPRQQILSHLPRSFVLFRPKDIVSGDFYWFGEKNGKKIIAAVDCTGHGVPGAFMSMIGNNLLNQIVIEKGITDPGSILNALNLGVQDSLKQGNNEIETSDGMDVALCSIDTATLEVHFAGAYRPLLIVSNGKLEKVDGTKSPIGGKQMGEDRNFITNIRMLKKGDTLYMFSDGYADQFGGPKGKKFMVKRMDQLILDMQGVPMPEQEKRMDDALESWRGDFQQVDDILVIGIRF